MFANLHQRLLIALFLALIYTPVAALLLQLPQAHLPNFPLSLLMRSVAFSTTVALVTGAISLLTAVTVWRCRRTPNWLPWLAIAMAVLPSYIHTLAWSPILARLRATMALDGWLAAGWVETMAFLPLAFCLSWLALSTTDPALVDAARLHRTPAEVLTKVILPLAAPTWLAGVSLIFVLSLADYTVPSLFSTATYALGIFAEFSAGAHPATALVLAAPLLAVSSLLLAAVHAPLRHAALRRRDTPVRLPGNLPLTWRLIEAVCATLGLLSVTVALFGLVRGIASPSALLQTAAASSREGLTSFAVAALAALAALAPSLAVARVLARAGRGATALWLLTLLPLSVPAPLTGIGLVALWNHSATGDVYGSAAMPVFAALARFLPVSALLLAAFVLRLDPLLEDAGRLFRRSRRSGLFRVTLPLLRPGLLAAAGAVFALTLGELGATLVVTPPGMATLSLRIYNYLHYGASDAVASLCLLTAAATLGCAWLVTRLVRP